MRVRLAAALVLVLGCARPSEQLTRASSTLYVRTDSDATTVVSPEVRVSGRIADVTLETGYTVDAWTGASVDVVTAATKAIHETRNAADVGVGYERRTARVSASYRYSTEPDYWSHGLTLGARWELANKNTTLGLDALASRDAVGRAGDPQLRELVGIIGGRASIAQVIDRRSIVELGWETTRVDGFQASPYRWVAIGGQGTCAGDAPFCVPEQAPRERWRSAALLRGRRALGRRASAGLEYRFYFDDWGVRSHAVQPDVAWRVTDAGTLALRFRYYTQGEASFYRPRYFDLAMTNGLVTRDRKLSAFFGNELGVHYLHRFELCDGQRAIVAGGRATGTRLDYLAFVGLDRVYALELTATVGIELE